MPFPNPNAYHALLVPVPVTFVKLADNVVVVQFESLDFSGQLLGQFFVQNLFDSQWNDDLAALAEE